MVAKNTTGGASGSRAEIFPDPSTPGRVPDSPLEYWGEDEIVTHPTPERDELGDIAPAEPTEV